MSSGSPTTCPTCGKVVDPLRARSVGVRDGKVVAYCSAACAAAAESRPNVKIRTPASGIAVVIPTSADSGPIIEIVREGSVPTSAPAPVTDAPSAKHAHGKNKHKRGKGNTPVAGAPVVASAGKPAAPKSEPADAKPADAKPADAKAPDAKAPDAKAPAAAVAARRDHTPTPVELAKRRAELAAAEEADEDAMINGDDAPPPRKIPVLLIVVIVAAIGGGVVLAVRMMSKSGTAHAASVSDVRFVQPQPQPHVEAAPVAPAAPTPAAVVEQARGVLRAQLTSGSPRVQRRAAIALSRTADASALDVLATALRDEPSEITRLDLAYALARGGDARGTGALVTALASPRRDVRAEAANELARLGDARATPVLAEYLDVSQLRVGAAEHLAYLAEPRAAKLLAALRADANASVDDRARAVIALGVAGDASVAPALRALLDDPRFNAFAAAALAALRDPSARPVLVAHLAIPSLRTDAARALRRLDPDLDATPLLPPLVAALASAKDTDAVQAAEAVLLLAGPAAWSRYE